MALSSVLSCYDSLRQWSAVQGRPGSCQPFPGEDKGLLLHLPVAQPMEDGELFAVRPAQLSVASERLSAIFSAPTGQVRLW